MPGVLTPRNTGPSLRLRGTGSKDEPLEFWKQIIPEQAIDYRNPKDGKVYHFDFNNAYHSDLIQAFKSGRGPDQVCFQLADPKNRHGRDYDPERQRGVTLDMTTYDQLPAKVRAEVDASGAPNRRGVYAKIRMFNKKAARVVKENPGLAVSARVREGHVRADGVPEGRAVVHILGTIDSQIVGMAPWTQADLAVYPDDTGTTIDLSTLTYSTEADPVAKSKGKNKSGGTATADAPLTPEDIAAMSDDELRALAEQLDVDLNDGEDEGDEDDDESSDDNDGADDQARELVGAGAGNADLANRTDRAYRAAQAAGQRADEAMQILADQNWRAEATRMIDQGVPPAAIDLCQPYLSNPGGFTIDLANGEDELDVAGDMRNLLGLFTGYVDLSSEAGHGGQFTPDQDRDTDAPVLDQWEREFPTGR